MLNNPYALLLLCLGGAFLLGALAIAMLRTRPVELKDKQAVIYRLGQFNRIEGPGLFVINRSLDTIEREINIRTEPADYRIPNLTSYGVPFGYTLNLWTRTNLKAAAKGNQETLRKLAQFTDEERRKQVITLLRSALLAALREQQASPLPEGAGVIQKLLPVLPSTEAAQELLGKIRDTLVTSLPSVGVFLDTAYPIVIQSVHLDESTLSSLGRGRRLELLGTQLRQQVGDMPPDMLLQAFGAVEGLDLLAMKRYFISDASGAQVELQDRGSADVLRIRHEAQPGSAGANEQGQAAASAGQPSAAPSPAANPSASQAEAAPGVQTEAQPGTGHAAAPEEPGTARINPDDWKVLRPPPRPQQRAG